VVTKAYTQQTYTGITSSLKIIRLMTDFPLLTNPSSNAKHKPSQRIVGATSGLLTLLCNIVVRVNTTLLLKWSHSRHAWQLKIQAFLTELFGIFKYEFVELLHSHNVAQSHWVNGLLPAQGGSGSRPGDASTLLGLGSPVSKVSWLVSCLVTWLSLLVYKLKTTMQQSTGFGPSTTCSAVLSSS
jgi:hypothetical protein